MPPPLRYEQKNISFIPVFASDAGNGDLGVKRYPYGGPMKGG
jgi:hypothetical protein